MLTQGRGPPLRSRGEGDGGITHHWKCQQLSFIAEALPYLYNVYHIFLLRVSAMKQLLYIFLFLLLGGASHAATYEANRNKTPTEQTITARVLKCCNHQNQYKKS